MNAFFFRTFSEFLASDHDWVYPPPGGYITGAAMTGQRQGHTNHDPDAFLTELARQAKTGRSGRAWAGRLQDGIEIIKRQTHFTPETDLLLLERIAEWIAELEPVGHA